MRMLVAFLAAVLVLGFVAGALAFPKVLLDAVQKTYAPRKVHIEALCHERIGGRLYVRVDVTLVKSGRARSAAFESTRAGWFAVWKNGKIRPAVAKSQRPRIRAAVKELHRYCG